jgi:hypothetical protein
MPYPLRLPPNDLFVVIGLPLLPYSFGLPPNALFIVVGLPSLSYSLGLPPNSSTCLFPNNSLPCACCIMLDKCPSLLKANYMFVPQLLEPVQIDKQTVKLYPVIDAEAPQTCSCIPNQQDCTFRPRNQPLRHAQCSWCLTQS